MKRETLLLCACLIGLLFRAEAEEIDVLILTGNNNHKWQETTPALKGILKGSGKFRVEVVTEPEKLTAAKLAEFDVLLSNWNNWVGKKKDAPPIAPWPEDLKKAYVEFVKNGGGHVMIHAGSSSFFDWDDYQDICCATWELGVTGHGPIHEFDIRISDADHPVTEGVKDFRTTDELWHRPKVRPGVRVLAQSFSDVTGQWEPAAMVRTFGKGRCFALMLGHGAEHMQIPGFQALLLRGTEWTAGKK